MLGKLIKYEFKACGRTFFPLYIGILCLSIVNGISLRSTFTDENWGELNTNLLNTQSILGLVLFALFVALFVINIVFIIQRFKKNLLGDEGYLMFTLPVKSSSLILSKFLVVLIYGTISAIVALLSFIVITTISGDINIIDFFKTLPDMFGGTMEFITYVICSALISYSIFVLTIYLSLSLGQLPKLSKHRTAAAVILFFLIDWVISIIQELVMNNFSGGMIESELADTIMTSSYEYLWPYLIISVGIGFVLFFSTNWLLNKKLNIE